MTVDVGQPLEALRTWVVDQGFGRHIVQSLIPKNDYARRYTVNSQAIMPMRPSTCAFLERKMMRFYSWNGKELPCCFIKNSSDFTTIPDVRAKIAMGEVLGCCAGCAYLKKIN